MWLILSNIASVTLDIEEAATIDGANFSRRVTRIVVPLVAPGVASTAIIVFLLVRGPFFKPLVFASTIATTPLSAHVITFVKKYLSDYGLQGAVNS